MCSTQVWQSDFCDKLRIRFATHHSKCTQCITHRMILKKLGHHGPARRSQFEELQRHLRRQHADRCVYYECRARSRQHATQNLGPLGTFQLCGILDPMDAVKYSWPKSRVMSTKLFSKFIRPKMSCTGFLIHGHMMLTVLTHGSLTCNSSRTVEVVSHALTELTRRRERPLDLRYACLHLQADNCVKECKNQTLLRHLGAQVALGKLGAAQLSFLSSGHSHEDIDALFSLLRSWIQRTPEMWTPTAYRECLEAFFDKPEHRPYEKHRKVIQMSTFRDWILLLLLQHFAVQTFVTLDFDCWPFEIKTRSEWPGVKTTVRKIFWSIHANHAHINGIGGPGAPHAFRLDRFEDAGPLLIMNCVSIPQYW